MAPLAIRARSRPGGALRAALAVAVLALPPAAARASGALRPVPDPSGSYGETFTFLADLDDGTYVQVSLGVTNLGPGSSHGLCRALVVSPGRAPWTETERVSSDGWSYRAGDEERLQVGPCSALAGPATVVQATFGEAAIRLVLAAPPAPVSPPGSSFAVGEGRFRAEVLLYRIPAEAALSLPGRPAVRLAGGGYADHSRGTVPPKDLALRWVRFRGLRGERGLLVLARQGRDGSFGPAWSTADLGSFVEHRSFRVRGGEGAGPSFGVELPAAAGSLEIEPGPLLYRDAPVESFGILAPLVRAFVGNPVTYVYRARAREGSGPEVAGILEVEVDD